jgi:hypothetical protein
MWSLKIGEVKVQKQRDSSTYLALIDFTGTVFWTVTSFGKDKYWTVHKS